MRRLAAGVAIVAALAAVASAGARSDTKPIIGPQRIGTVRFGAPEPAAVAGLTQLLGPPSARFPNTACGPRYSEVAWGRLYAEFRLGRFSGFRYLAAGWPSRRFRRPSPTVAHPRLATDRGVTLGSTLAELRRADGPLRRIGADRWRGTDGLVFGDDARRDPAPPSSRIVAIERDACGAF